jgi:hypothetical protein
MASPETMLTAFLNTNSVIFINWLPPGEKFDNGYFCEGILEPLSRIMHSWRAARSARPILGFDMLGSRPLLGFSPPT